MTRALTRANFHRSRFIRVLADLSLVDGVEPGGDFAEKLGPWLNLHDAITLCAVLNASPPAAPAGAKPDARSGLADELARIRAGLANSINGLGMPKPGRSGMELPLPKPGVPLEVATDYEPYRRYYLARQRELEASIRPLRSRARELLAKASPALAKLAALDATFDAILGDRESKLLASAPWLLERRFAQLLKAHQQRLAETHQAENPALWMKTGAWLARFCQELQTLLLAELDLRLQPTLGLIEALNNEMTAQK